MDESEGPDEGRLTRRRDPEQARHASTARPRRRRAPWLIALAVLAVLGGWAGWLAYDAVQARGELLAAAELLAGLQDDVLAGDTDVSETLAEVQAHAAAARGSTHGVHWSAASALPWVGGNVRAVQAVSEVVDTLAADVLPDLADVAAVVDPAALAPVDGRVDLAPLEQAAPVVVAAAEKVAQGQQRLEDIDEGALWDVVASPLVDLRTKLDQLAMTTTTASRAVQLLPPMLGGDGPRTYLVLVQNPAEPRATGGVPALVVLRAEGGALTLIDQRGADMGNMKDPALPLTSEELSLFSGLLGSYMADVTFTPDFPRSAELAQAIWEQETEIELDGVLSIDPAALASILGVTGGVVLANGVELTSENAASWLMNTVYLDYATGAQHDALFAEATAAMFARVTTGDWDPVEMVEALASAARNGHLIVWADRSQEQSLISGTVLSGQLVREVEGPSVVGVFFNDGSQSKLGYYLEAEIDAEAVACRSDGTQELTLRLTVSSKAPADAASLPIYVSGGGQVVPAGQMRVNVLLYAPRGGLVDDVNIDGADGGVHSQRHDGLAVVAKTVTLAPGQRVTIEYDLLTGGNQRESIVIRTTPLAMLSAPETVESACG